MRRRKSILPALVIEAIAVFGLAGLYLSTRPFHDDGLVERDLPQVEYLADDSQAIPTTTRSLDATRHWAAPVDADQNVSLSHRPLPSGVIHVK